MDPVKSIPISLNPVHCALIKMRSIFLLSVGLWSLLEIVLQSCCLQWNSRLVWSICSLGIILNELCIKPCFDRGQESISSPGQNWCILVLQKALVSWFCQCFQTLGFFFPFFFKLTFKGMWYWPYKPQGTQHSVIKQLSYLIQKCSIRQNVVHAHSVKFIGRDGYWVRK